MYDVDGLGEDRMWEQENAALKAEIARLTAERDALRRTIWMLLTEAGGGWIAISRKTKENYPGDDRAVIEQTAVVETGATLMRPLSANEQKP